jgi:hypothetical protein
MLALHPGDCESQQTNLGRDASLLRVLGAEG